MRLSKVVGYLLVVGIGIGLTGCASKSISVEKTESEITSDKSKAYIVFSRPYNFLGGGNSIDIVQFNNRNFEPKYVAYLSAGERVIHQVTAGKKYFFTDVGANENIILIKTKPGNIYYVNIGVTGEAIFFPKLYKERRLTFTKSLEEEKCSNSFLEKYLFKLEVDKDEEISYTVEKNPITRYKSIIQFDIECQNGDVISLKDKYYVHTLSELKETDLIKPNEKAMKDFSRDIYQYKKDIKAYYPTWNFKFKNVPMTESVFLDVKQIVEASDFRQYTDFNVVPSKNNTLDKEVIEEFTVSLDSKFSHINKDKTVTIEYTLNKLDTGDMFGRYMTMGIAKNSYRSNVGVIDIDIVFKDTNNNILGAIRLTQLEAGGFLGGINTLKQDVINAISEYAIKNFIYQER